MRLPIRAARIFTLPVLGLTLLATLPADAQTTSGPVSSQPPTALQNLVIARADGTIYLVRDGARHLVSPVSLSDDDIAAIPEGAAYSNGLVPVDAITALVGGSGSGPAIGSVILPPPAAASVPAQPAAVAASTPAPTSTPPPTLTPTASASLPSSVKVSLDEWSITPDATTLAAGKVSFDVTDTGKGEHEMGLYKTDKDPASLPVSKGKVDETAIGQKIGELEGFKSGDEKSGSFDLKPGTYILICNLTNHYNKGMVSQVQVK
jgi:uncharacterized cupredoxin-like copper-binding protein